MANEAITLSNTATGFSKLANTLRYAGTTATIAGIVIGVVSGAYFTHKFCEELIDKFVDFYRNNKDKIRNSYEEAVEYFSLENKQNNANANE